MPVGFPELQVVVVLLTAFIAIVYPVSRICSRMGFPRLLALLAFVPVANLVVLWYVALATWPGDAGTGRV